MSDTKPNPGRARVPTYLVVILLSGAVIGGGSIVWSWMHRDRLSSDVIPLENGAPRKIHQPVLVMLDKTSAIRAVAGGVEMRLLPPSKDKKAELHLRPVGEALVNPQQELALRTTRRLANAPAGLVKRLSLTPDQVQKLKQVQLDFELKATPQEQARIETLCLAWQKASADAKFAAQTQLITALKEIGPKTVAAARQAVAQSTTQARACLTPAQWQQYQDLVAAKSAAKPAAAAPASVPVQNKVTQPVKKTPANPT